MKSDSTEKIEDSKITHIFCCESVTGEDESFMVKYLHAKLLFTVL